LTANIEIIELNRIVIAPAATAGTAVSLNEPDLIRGVRKVYTNFIANFSGDVEGTSRIRVLKRTTSVLGAGTISPLRKVTSFLVIVGTVIPTSHPTNLVRRKVPRPGG